MSLKTTNKCKVHIPHVVGNSAIAVGIGDLETPFSNRLICISSSSEYLGQQDNVNGTESK